MMSYTEVDKLLVRRCGKPLRTCSETPIEQTEPNLLTMLIQQGVLAGVRIAPAFRAKSSSSARQQPATVEDSSQRPGWTTSYTPTGMYRVNTCLAVALEGAARSLDGSGLQESPGFGSWYILHEVWRNSACHRGDVVA